MQHVDVPAVLIGSVEVQNTMMWQGIDKNTPFWRCLGSMKIQKSWKTKTFESVVTTLLVIFMIIYVHHLYL